MLARSRRVSSAGMAAVLVLVSLFSLSASAQDKAAPQPPSWTPVASMAEGRTDYAAVALQDNRTLVVGGGSTTSGPGLATCEIWNPATRTWSTTGAMARPRFAHTATRLLDGRVLVVGGLLSFSLPFPPEVELYDPALGTWSLAAPIPVPRAFHAAVLLKDGRVFVVGGDAPGTGDTATAYIYDPASNTWSSAGSMSVAREPGRFGAIVLSNGDVLVVGGYDVTTGQSFAAADRYSVAFATWTTLPNLAESRNANTLELLPDGRVVVVGGKDAGQIRSSMEIFDPATNTWALGPSLLKGRWAHTTANLGSGRILAMGGRTSSGDSSSTELFDVATLTWRTVAPMNNNRFKFGSTVTVGQGWVGESFVKIRRILAIGGFTGTGVTNGVDEMIVPPWGWPNDPI
jgi:hypothetical protein